MNAERTRKGVRMRKQERGAVLTSVIIMVLVMTLIGVPLLGMVVMNYRLRAMNNALKSSEYENEMALDRIYLVIRESVISAIDYAKDNSTNAVNATSELQRTQYSSVRAKYEDLWIKTLDNNNGVIDDDMLDELGTIPDSIRVQLKNATNSNEAKQIYVDYQIEVELSEVHDENLSSDNFDALYVGSLVNSENGVIDDEALKAAYNKVFQYYYQMYMKETVSLSINLGEEEKVNNSNVIEQIKKTDNYTSISATKIITDGSEPTEDSYLKIDASLSENVIDPTVLNIYAEVAFRRDGYVLPSKISATFVVGTPEFDSVTNVEQQTVALSNPITSQGVTVGGTLRVAENSSLLFNNDITVMSYNENTGEDVDNGIVLENGSIFESTGDSRISVNGDILLKNGSKFVSGTNPLYYRNLYVGQLGDGKDTSYTVDFNGNVVAKDDLEINTDGTVKIIMRDSKSNYYGFNDVNEEGPDSSSAIVVNSEELSNKTLSLGNLYLAGRAFIDGAIGTRVRYIEDVNGKFKKNDEGIFVEVKDGTGTHRREDVVYKTGESVAVRGNYIAYQSPIYNNTDYTPDKINYSAYFIENKTDAYGKNKVPIYLADSFIKVDNNYTEKDYTDFDTSNKSVYFLQYAQEYAEILKRLKVSGNIKYMEGTGFNASGSVVSSVKSDNTAFRVNLATEYEKYTQYFGYRPIDNSGNVDMSKAKTKIFGSNGWIATNSSLRSKTTADYRLIYDVSGSKNTITLSGDKNKGIIICKGDLDIEVSDDATFSGMIVVGGNLTVKGGGTLTLSDSKEENINTIIGNYLGKNSEVTGEGDGLFQIFEYDNSGTTYVVTEVNDAFINVNDLINITNWKKQTVNGI